MIIIKEPENSYSRKALKEFSEVDVSGGKRWKPVPHSEFADTLIEKLHDAEYATMNEKWYLNSTQSIMIGSVDIKPETTFANPLRKRGFFTLVVRNSVNQKYAPSFACAAKIDIIEDIHDFYTGELDLKKRQWDSFNIDDVLEMAVVTFTQACDRLQERYDALSKAKVDKLKAYGLICKAASKGLMPFRHIEYVKKEYDSNIDKGQIINLFRAFNVSFQKLGPMDQFTMVSELYPLITELL